MTERWIMLTFMALLTSAAAYGCLVAIFNGPMDGESALAGLLFGGLAAFGGYVSVRLAIGR